jgi:2-hydroxychromene-2-carboxylate isomerase
VAALLYFDLGSPYAYLAVERAKRVFGEAPVLRPMLLGAVFKQRGFGSWADTDARAMRMAEIEQRAARYGLPPMVWPTKWPTNGLTAMRCAVWADREGALDAFTRAVFRSEFAAGGDIASPALLLAAADEVGLDGEAMLEGARDPAVKQALRESTDEAWAAGARGAPSLRVGDAVFFGDDQLELAASALASAG